MSAVPDFFNPNDPNQNLNVSSESRFCLRNQFGELIDKHGFATVIDTLAMIIKDEYPKSKSLFELKSAVQIIEEEGL